MDSSSKVNYAPDIRAGSTGRRVGYYGVNTYLELPDDNQFLLVMPQSFTGTDATITIVYKEMCIRDRYMRIREITLGYTLPKYLLKRMGIGSLRIYGSAFNPVSYTHLVAEKIYLSA